jgi:hypothetical protein
LLTLPRTFVILADMVAIYNDAKHWRERAEEARRIAAQFTDLESRKLMLKVAADYDRLAERAALRIAKDSDGDA